MLCILVEPQGCCYWYVGWNSSDDVCSVWLADYPLKEQLGDDIVLVNLVSKSLTTFVLSHECEILSDEYQQELDNIERSFA